MTSVRQDPICCYQKLIGTGSAKFEVALLTCHSDVKVKKDVCVCVCVSVRTWVCVSECVYAAAVLVAWVVYWEVLSLQTIWADAKTAE